MSRENRQVGEAVAWLIPGVENDMLVTEAALVGDAVGRGFVVQSLIPASDLEQVSRERDEAVRLLRECVKLVPGVGAIDAAVAFLNNLDNRNE